MDFIEKAEAKARETGSGRRANESARAKIEGHHARHTYYSPPALEFRPHPAGDAFASILGNSQLFCGFPYKSILNDCWDSVRLGL